MIKYETGEMRQRHIQGKSYNTKAYKHPYTETEDAIYFAATVKQCHSSSKNSKDKTRYIKTWYLTVQQQISDRITRVCSPDASIYQLLVNVWCNAWYASSYIEPECPGVKNSTRPARGTQPQIMKRCPPNSPNPVSPKLISPNPNR